MHSDHRHPAQNRSLKLLEKEPMVLKFVLMCFGKNVLVISLIVFQE